MICVRNGWSCMWMRWADAICRIYVTRLFMQLICCLLLTVSCLDTGRSPPPPCNLKLNDTIFSEFNRPWLYFDNRPGFVYEQTRSVGRFWCDDDKRRISGSDTLNVTLFEELIWWLNNICLQLWAKKLKQQKQPKWPSIMHWKRGNRSWKKSSEKKLNFCTTHVSKKQYVLS
jgi:hypothetical protein